jgi:hypothetical protein
MVDPRHNSIGETRRGACVLHQNGAIGAMLYVELRCPEARLRHIIPLPRIGACITLDVAPQI